MTIHILVSPCACYCSVCSYVLPSVKPVLMPCFLLFFFFSIEVLPVSHISAGNQQDFGWIWVKTKPFAHKPINQSAYMQYNKSNLLSLPLEHFS